MGYASLWHLPSQTCPFSFRSHPVPLLEGFSKSLVAGLAELGQNDIFRPGGISCFKEQLAEGTSSWRAIPFSQSPSILFPKFDSSMLAQGLGRCSSRNRSYIQESEGWGTWRRRRRHEEEEEALSLHHWEGSEVRKKIPRSLRYKIVLKKCLSVWKMHHYLG